MIEVVNLKKSYGKKRVLSSISFQAACGECVVIVGRNGCGKTTLLQILAGIIKPDEGSVTLFGENPLKNRKLHRKYCGYVPQELPLIGELSVKDNLRLWGAHRGSAYEQIVDMFHLEEIMKMRVDQLSGGMQRRLSMACALAEWPPILLMDEPVTALDLHYKDSVDQWIADYKKLNGIVIMTTHDEKQILNSDRCLFMKDGILKEIPKEDLSIDLLKSML